MQRKTLDEHLGAFLPPLLSGIRLAPKPLATCDLSFVRSSSSCSLHEQKSVNRRPICANKCCAPGANTRTCWAKTEKRRSKLANQAHICFGIAEEWWGEQIILKVHMMSPTYCSPIGQQPLSQRWWRHADSKKDLKGNELLIAAARLSEEPLKLNNFSLLITASLA